MSKNKPELLSPAGDMEKLKFALAYGADAVYLGGDRFSLRTKSGNFDAEEIAAAVAYAHGLGKKVYVAVNVFAHNEDIAALPPFLAALAEIGPDGLLISDPGVFLLAREHAPSLPIHISTQANNVNWKTARFWRELGAERIVLGRELTLAEIREIRAKTDMELELFVHGAMCMAYSGRCLLSNFLTGRDANRGACAHPCRWRYALVEAERPGEYLPVEEDGHGSYILNSRDLALLPYLPELVKAGVDSLKIEGRVKSAYYAAVVTGVYRRAVDDLFEDEEAFRARIPAYMAELETVSHRRYFPGFLPGRPDEGGYRYDTSAYVRRYDFIAVVKGYDEEKGRVLLEQRNHFRRGETAEFVPAGEAPCALKLESLFDEEGTAIEKAPHAQMTVAVPSPRRFPPLTVVRRKKQDV